MFILSAYLPLLVVVGRCGAKGVWLNYDRILPERVMFLTPTISVTSDLVVATFPLQDSLAGDSKTMMIAQISPV